MTQHQYKNTSTHMVNVVRGIIDGYRMGPIRALAQEPVQNAKDAKDKDSPDKTVHVEYRLLRRQIKAGSPCYLLTVSDWGTCGLRGPIELSPEELSERDYQPREDENWAAFEGQGFSKENEDALGSRGQGKAAFLYHSHVPGARRRMLTLYDTLLKNGEYRLGVRFASPDDQVRQPLFNDEARFAIQEGQHEVFENLSVPLGLPTLDKVGSRIIIPFLSDEALDSIRSGELTRWLARCWWRAIQKGQLKITIVDEEYGKEDVITVPTWWRDLPRGGGGLKEKGEFLNLNNGASLYVCGDIRVLEGHGILRLALYYDENLTEDEIIDDHPEYAGVQLLRGNQWIETRGSRAEYADLIPKDKRPGFRGFVEFYRQTDAELRDNENSQHDDFKSRKLF